MSDRHASSGQTPRRALRRKVFQPAELRFAERVERVHLLDLSVSGALLHAAIVPRVGMTVSLTCGSVTRSARVMWVTGARFGIAFAMPLDDVQVATMIDGEAVRTR